MLNAVHMPVPDAELRRRQDLALSVMEKNGVDAVIMFTWGDMVAGPIKWLSGVAHYYSLGAVMDKECFAIFRSGDEYPIDADMPVVKKGETQLPHRVWSCAYVPGMTHAVESFGKAMEIYIRKRGFKKLGWFGLNYINAAIYKYLTENLKDLEFVDLTAAMDEVRLVKGEYEMERYKHVVYIHDRLLDFCYASLRPNMTNRMLDREVLNKAMEMGCVEFNTSLIRSWRGDRALGVDEQYQIGDYVYMLIEVAGPSGEWGEIARLFRIGMEPEKIWVERSDKLLEMQKKVAKACVPGAVAEEVFEYCKKLQAEAGFFPESRMCIHGQGVDIVDLPTFTPGDKTVLKEGMFIAIHPAWAHEAKGSVAPYFSYTDNFVIEKDGAHLLNKTPQKIFTVEV
ncbi:MAG: M24 family metallopeptidase [Firmicutes bacterium]|nr:M24 family metallopeptidase [Bacillota bacterium]MBQ1524442.1 M24 family metallopeptidase [Bacillota bacterium]MBQ1888046.1 M24 family metallopeptidase [Bacillota bacterium]MBQ2456060.1 M24 family metallopeptidase [Bacillota bacterium]MBQ3579257.1 M24 family metallopeptidase [Bacillota bacterium]